MYFLDAILRISWLGKLQITGGLVLVVLSINTIGPLPETPFWVKYFAEIGIILTWNGIFNTIRRYWHDE